MNNNCKLGEKNDKKEIGEKLNLLYQSRILFHLEVSNIPNLAY